MEIKIVRILCLILFSTFIVSVEAQFTNSQIQDRIDWLQKRLEKSYWSKDQKYVFPIKWEHQKGIYKSEVHLNFLDGKNGKLIALMREQLGVHDINMFVTSFCLFGLLEAKILGTITIDQHQFSESLMAINQYKDRNVPEGIPQFVFWPQVNNNGTWSAAPKNLINSINLLPSFGPGAANFLNKIGLGLLANAKQIAKYFYIPADNDDSSVNLALLGLLNESNSTHYNFWNSYFPKKMAYYEKALKYAYRPFSPRKDLNIQGDEIDPRTYFVLHQFIEKKKQQSQNPSLILPTTWLLSASENIEGKLKMPFDTNNVDSSVCANFLFGLFYQVINKEISFDDNPELLQMVMNTVQLIEYSIQVILEKRPTLILVYYPSKYDYYWFCARILQLLKRHEESLVSPLPEIKSRFEKLMKDISTPQILKSAKIETGVDLDTTYWVEFLGNYGRKDRNQDAIFSTALALNALLDIWTLRKGSKLEYDPQTPTQVKLTIKNGIAYLMKHLKKGMIELNAFFSGSLKNFDSTFPYFFPVNSAKDKNGNNVDPTTMKLTDIKFKDGIRVVMKGFIEPEKYQEMLKKSWFGHKVPEQQVSLNTGKGASFPFWSSEAFVEIMSITALSKFMKAQESVQN